MTKRILLALCALSVLSGCPKNEATAEPPTDPSGKATGEGPKVPADPTMPPAGAAITGGKAPTHFVLATPPAASTKCAPLPKGGSGSTARAAEAIRRLACEPALYYKPAAEVAKELALPPELKLEYNGPASISLEFPRAKASDLAKAMGIDKPVAGRARVGAWQWRIWTLASNDTTGELDHWGPGRSFVSLSGVDYSKLDSKTVVTEMTEEQFAEGHASVSMPESVLPIKDDEVAVKMLVAGLEKIAANTKLLSDEPPAVARAAALDDERFRLSRRSIGTGPSATKGIDVWAARTRIAAGPLIKALGLQGKISHRRARDSDDYLLYDSHEGQHRWRGLSVELSFMPRKDGNRDDYGGYVLSGVTLMP